ncbi:SNF2 family N-terminal domain-domain-containing protein [Kockovaella imperatae]|uniref:SNF2 family N-terminal domain-domain-containing protein n=1 Tax=Kockovaella imperatae TaxID=4999 RepID=A0A1Y1UF60_9TREE|nr:SNF2 family N-terminal domain-domain-containing protein [Kockovaella imperatae]ORX36629.1 SNF2 family N-terminal domain-domain-containing protein [Kockovaella imperatae]
MVYETGHTTAIPRMMATLKPHQIKGLEWMQGMEAREDTSGGVLADDMGLGKTLEALALICSDVPEKGQPKPTLVVVPRILVKQWVDEIKRYTHLKVGFHLETRSEFTTNRYKRKYDIVLTTYTILSSLYRVAESYDREDVEATIRDFVLFGIEWRRIILDEAHMIRTIDTKMSLAVRKLMGRKRWCMTGTPIFNHIEDIFPYFFFTNEMSWEEFQDQILDQAAVPGLAKARELLAQIMLRRRREECSELKLPKMSQEDILVDLGPEEQAIYQNIYSDGVICANPFLPEGTVLKSLDFSYARLTCQRQAACHPAHLVLSSKSQALEGPVVEADRPLCMREPFEPLETVHLTEDLAMEHGLECYRQDLPDCKLPISSKMREIGRIIDLIHAGDPKDKTLVFCSWRLMLDLMIHYLEGQGRKCLRLHSKTNELQREAILQGFKRTKGPNILLMTPLMGGIGLNLAAANHVILVDPSWSPSTERQAISRVHRLGQKREMTVWKLLARGTIDEDIVEKQQRKNLIISHVVEGEPLGAGSVPGLEDLSSLTVKDIANLYVETPHGTTSVSQDDL